MGFEPGLSEQQEGSSKCTYQWASLEESSVVDDRAQGGIHSGQGQSRESEKKGLDHLSTFWLRSGVERGLLGFIVLQR